MTERTRLRPLLRRIELPQMGAEDVVVDHDGNAWTGTGDGSVFRVSPAGDVVAVGHTGGRPLGLELYGPDRLLVADAHRGLLTMSTTTGAVGSLVAEVDGRRMQFCNNAAVTSDGDIWFSDSSTVYGIEDWKADFVEDTRTGRLLCRRADGTVEVHLEGLGFANGVALAAGEEFVCVAESARRSVVRLWLTGERAGTTDLLAAELPGYPDNIARGSDGLIWVTIASPVDPLVELIRRRAPRFAQRAVARLPEAVQPRPRRTVRVLAFDDSGRVVHDVDAAAEEFHMVTGVREHLGQVWFASLHESALAVVSLPAGAD
jgi:sugar lactone lactonase YvrE